MKMKTEFNILSALQGLRVTYPAIAKRNDAQNLPGKRHQVFLLPQKLQRIDQAIHSFDISFYGNDNLI